MKFLILFIVGLLYFGQAQAAVLYAESAYQTVEVGQSFIVDWFLDSEQDSINLATLTLRFTPDTLELLEVPPGSSLFNVWITPPKFSNQLGLIELAGGIAGGLENKKIPVFRSVFRAREAGAARIEMDSGSAVFKSDGHGTPARLLFQVLDFIVAPAGSLPIPLSSPSHPDQNSWSRERRAVVRFTPKSNEEYSYSFSSNVEIFPDEQPDAVPEEIVYDALPDGIYYFKLNSRSREANWQEVGIFRIQIDGTAPEDFSPRVVTDPGLFGGTPFLVFSAIDKTSGISHYKVKGAFVGVTETQSPFRLGRPLIESKIKVEAVDFAGNSQTGYLVYPGLIPKWLALVIFLALAGGAGFLIRKKLTTKTKQ